MIKGRSGWSASWKLIILGKVACSIFSSSLHQRVEIERREMRFGLARRGQELLHERRAPLDRFLDDLIGTGDLRLAAPKFPADWCIRE